jgi:hypothetical protein
MSREERAHREEVSGSYAKLQALTADWARVAEGGSYSLLG